LSDDYGSGYYRKNEVYGTGIDDSIPEEHAFFFRLSGLNLYYTATQHDMNVLGAIAIINVESSSPS